jgi:hypothetical protein
MRTPKILCLTIVTLMSGVGPAYAQSRPPEQEQFWAGLTALCNKAFEGKAVEAPAGNTTYVDKRLIMHVRRCEPNVISIPFHVGENRSRTWVITRTESGLRLKHDHRHEDGSEDTVTQYGGDTVATGSAVRQDFPTDNAQGAPTIWFVEVHPGRSFAYGLRREGTDRRFRIEFDLSKDVPPPPAPWGHK